MVRLRPALRPLPSPKVTPTPLYGARPRRVGIVCDFLEEGWPSMDLAAELLGLSLAAHGAGRIQPALLRPKLRLRFGRRVGATRLLVNADRYVGRYVDYPRWLRKRRAEFDLFHVADHSYAHLVHVLPAERTVVTCHDLDAFRSLLEPAAEPRPLWFRATMRRVLAGMRRAAHVFCDSEAVRAELVARRLLPPERTSVAPLPVHPDFRPDPPAAAVRHAAQLLGGPPDPAHPEVLHVGSVVPRKRIDRLLRVFAAVRARHPGARLVRVGGPLTDELSALAEALGVRDALREVPSVGRAELAAVYARAAVLLQPSEREGFGLPVVEAMACGTPVVASDLPVLRETGGAAAYFAGGDDVQGWVDAVDPLLREARDPAARAAHRHVALRHAARHSTAAYADALLPVYRRLMRMPAGEEQG